MYKQKRRFKHIDFALIDILITELIYLILAERALFGIRLTVAYLIPLFGLLISLVFRFYRRILARTVLSEFLECAKYMCTLCACILIYLFIRKNSAEFSRVLLTEFFFTGLISLFLAHLVYRQIVIHFLKKHKSNVVIISDHEESYMTSLEKRNDMHIVRIINETPDVFELYREENTVDEVFLDVLNQDKKAEWLSYLLQSGLPVHIVIADMYEGLPNPFIEHIENITVLTTSNAIANSGELLVKRLMDIAGGIVGLIITGIAAIIFGPIIKHQSPGPIFYKQIRIGRNGRQFQIYKFRSMYPDADQRKKELEKENKIDGHMFKVENDPRIIPIGHFMRKHSIDELPQFLNVLKGDMALVGTRPPTLDEWESYSPHHRARMSAKPGLTGVWQVSGRSDITDFEEVVRMDTDYIKNWSIWMDIKLILKTVVVVFRGDGAE